MYPYASKVIQWASKWPLTMSVALVITLIGFAFVMGIYQFKQTCKRVR